MRRLFLILPVLTLTGCEPEQYFGASAEADAYDHAALRPLGSPQDVDDIKKLILDQDDDFRGITIHWISANEAIAFATKENPYNHYYCAMEKKAGRWHCDMIYETMVD